MTCPEYPPPLKFKFRQILALRKDYPPPQIWYWPRTYLETNICIPRGYRLVLGDCSNCKFWVLGSDSPHWSLTIPSKNNLPQAAATSPGKIYHIKNLTMFKTFLKYWHDPTVHAIYQQTYLWQSIKRLGDPLALEQFRWHESWILALPRLPTSFSYTCYHTCRCVDTNWYKHSMGSAIINNFSFNYHSKASLISQIQYRKHDTQNALADPRVDAPGTSPLGIHPILSCSCSLWQQIYKIIGCHTHFWELAPPQENPGSATVLWDWQCCRSRSAY